MEWNGMKWNGGNGCMEGMEGMDVWMDWMDGMDEWMEQFLNVKVQNLTLYVFQQ